MAQPGWTRWSIVYDITSHEVQWKTESSPARKLIRFSDVDFSCAAAMKMADVATDALTDYSPQANLELMVRSYAGT